MNTIIKAVKYVSLFSDITETVTIKSDGTMITKRSNGNPIKTFVKWDHNDPHLVSKVKDQLKSNGYALTEDVL